MRALFAHEGKKGDLLQASIELFAARGYHAVSVRDIAKAAGVSEAALYKHFKTKEEMALYIFTMIITYYTGRLTAIDAKTRGTAEKLCRVVDVTYELFEEHPAEIKVALLSQYIFWDQVKEQIKPHFVLKKILKEGMEKGEIPRQPVYLWISLFSGLMLKPLEHYQYFSDELPGLPEIRTQVKDMLHKLLSFSALVKDGKRL